VVHRRRIELGITQGDTIEIARGLSTGDEIVIVGHESLNENTPVRIVGAEGDSTMMASPPMDGRPGMGGDSARRAEWRKRAAERGFPVPDSGAVRDTAKMREMRERWQQRRNSSSGTQSQ
jgi:hypothetical protein